jgi:hypothetical protein
MPINPFVYPAISTGSNYAPLAFEIRDGSTGRPVDLTGATVTVTVRDELTMEPIVEDSPGSVSGSNQYVAQYVFDPADVAKILVEGTWLVEWRIAFPNERVFRLPVPYRLPVRPKL